MWFNRFFKIYEVPKKIKRDFLKYDDDDVYTKLKFVLPNKIKNDDVVFVYIGTDRSTGDSLGPLVGTYLTLLGYNNVYGTIDEPVHAENIKDVVSKIPRNKKIIAIDSCLGRTTSIGNIEVYAGSLYPGAGVGKNLLPIGDYSITAVVNAGTQDESINYQVLQCTRLSFVMSLAKKIVNGIVQVFPLYDNVFSEVAMSVDYDELLLV